MVRVERAAHPGHPKNGRRLASGRLSAVLEMALPSQELGRDVQQMREAWPYTPAHRFLLFDRDSKFGTDVISSGKEMGTSPVRTAFRSPWQNGIAERWVGSCRRDLLDHVIVLNERHLKRFMAEYVSYYHEDRTHLGLAKDTPAGRLIALRPAGGKIRSLPRLGGLHHRYAA